MVRILPTHKDAARYLGRFTAADDILIDGTPWIVSAKHLRKDMTLVPTPMVTDLHNSGHQAHAHAILHDPRIRGETY